ncbi:nucleotide exchange factor GrpE [Glutamicibacter creatinolyticus]|uniref:Protein GrpE n=1 Tax=Glutamicibacter creatinolyticus TaxID=162496 RepID=A0A5B7WV53_9MICC|nr:MULTISPECIES: nucleotide exchange factor GrpE [Glutamicibacter]QCY47971.1 Nucleotide exchange factor GrpE [Glutamicibacter creatinolyticus]TLK50875.1 nucleotide exchange factor GrpE [Glutamicibacter sp. V16R2B1]
MSEAQDQNANSGQQPENQQEAAEAQPNADALGQAEAILNEAGVSAEQSEQDEVGEVVTELRNDLLRLQAEYVNYRKRVERDREAVRDQAVQSVLATLLPVLDDVDAARKHGDLTDGPFAAIANKLDAVLQSHGLERIDQAGVEFDPNVHEALLRQPVEGIDADHVGQILRIGYKKGERILRAAQVMVSTGE